MQTYYPPKFQEQQFHCIHCGVFAAQQWQILKRVNDRNYLIDAPIAECLCVHCDEPSYWDIARETMVVPDTSTGAPRHADLPQSCHQEYDEAQAVVAKSPRAAAALLRLAIQKLMAELGEGGKNINGDIAALVAKGLPEEVQQALDICRVIGNHAVHPGEIDLNDTPEVASHLFEMINFIVEDRISRPKRVSALYARLPEKDRKAIQRRDSKAQDEPPPNPK